MKLLPLALALAPLPALAQTPLVNPEAARPDDEARRASALDRLTFRPGVAGVAGVEATLVTAPAVTPTIKANADALRAAALAASRTGRQGEAMRSLYQAIALLTGSDWARDAFAASLTADLDTPVADRDRPVQVMLRGAWPEIAPAGAMAVRFTLAPDGPGGAAARDLGVQPFTARDVVAAPQRFALPLDGVAPGHYRLTAEVSRAGAPAARLTMTIDVIDGLYATAADIHARLARISGHEAAKATILYPFSLARDLNDRQREVLRYDFTAAIARSRALLAALEAGRDPILRAKGDLRRARFDAEAGTIVPYRLFVPSRWDGKTALPMVVFLHGANLDENDGIERGKGVLAKLAEERGVILVAPLGYRMNSPYGAVLPAPAGDFGMLDDPDPRRVALSEADVLAVTDLVAAEYGVDRQRVYLMGNSMGGMGTWYLGAKYASRWAAISPSAGGVNDPAFDYGPLRAMPIRGVGGELDGARIAVQKAVAATNAAGGHADYIQIPGGTHGSAVEIAAPGTFDFFAQHREGAGH